jgi:hypothetical protein
MVVPRNTTTSNNLSHIKPMSFVASTFLSEETGLSKRCDLYRDKLNFADRIAANVVFLPVIIPESVPV